MKKSLALPYFPMYSFPAMNTPTVITFDIASQIVNLSKKIGTENYPNDLTLRLDVAVRDVFNTNSRLDQSNAYGTGGQKEITLQPSVDYVLNSKINLRFFFDQRRATPYISSAPPITNTRAGVNVRIAL